MACYVYRFGNLKPKPQRERFFTPSAVVKAIWEAPHVSSPAVVALNELHHAALRPSAPRPQKVAPTPVHLLCEAPIEPRSVEPPLMQDAHIRLWFYHKRMHAEGLRHQQWIRRMNNKRRFLREKEVRAMKQRKRQLEALLRKCSEPSSKYNMSIADMTELRELRKVMRDRLRAHATLLQEHREAKEARIVWPDIPRGVKRPTSVKQTKVRTIIPDTSATWTDEELLLRPQVRSSVRLPRQARFAAVLDRITRSNPVNIGVLGQPAVRQYRPSVSALGLVEGLLRKQAFFMMEKYPALRDALEQYELEAKESHPPATPNMEDAHGTTTTLEKSVKGNVALDNPLATTRNVADVQRQQGFLPMSSATETQTFNRLTERWLKYSKQVRWNTSDAMGKLLVKLKLPYDILDDNPTSPNVLLFMIHKYARFNMRVKILVNSNKFQVGQVQASWMYNGHINANQSLYDNVYSASQRSHVLINAGASNWGELEIPYWALTSAINLKTNHAERSEGISALSLGELSLRVLAPLKVPDGATVLSAAFLTILVSFEGLELRGLCDKEIHSPFNVASPNMEELVNTTERVLTTIAPVFSMDKPPKPEVATNIVPVASHAFSTVKRQNEVITALRADPLAQTPGVKSGEGRSTSLRSLLSRWSLMTTFKWSSTDEMGHALFSMDAAPIQAKSLYSSQTIAGRTFYNLPIMANLASMFAYWRGDLELRFDFVATQFHSGSIMVATIPGGEGNETIDEAKNSANESFSLLDNHQFIYRVQYYGGVPFWKVKHNLDRQRDVNPPSKVMVYVMNPLIPMQSVTPEIQINVYVRGCENFEFALLKTPSLALGYNPHIYYPTSSSAWVSPDYPQMFTAGSRWSGNMLCFFDSETTDYFTQFLGLESGKVYKVPTSASPVKIDGTNAYFRCQYYVKAGATNVLKDVTHMVRLAQYPWYPVVACFASEVNAKAYAKDPTQANLTKYGLATVQQGPWAQMSGDGTTWFNIDRSTICKVPFEVVTTESDALFDFEVVTPNMNDQFEEVTSSISLDVPARPSGFGKRVFGENVTSLTEVCKRWQHCGCGVYKEDVVRRQFCLSQTSAALAINVHPIRRFQVASTGDRDNRLRDGAISLVASAFAGYRGGMRYRVVFTGDMTRKFSIMAVHKYDSAVSLNVPSVDVRKRRNITASDWADTAYSSVLQTTFVNNVLEFEVPFYNRGEYNSTYTVNSAAIGVHENYYALGQVLIYITGLKKDDVVGFDVYYSVADDFAFSNFQGFGPSFFLDEIPAEPNMDYIKSFLTTPKKLGDVCDVIKSTAGSIGNKVVNVLSSVSTTVKSAAQTTISSIPSFSSIISTCGGFAHTLLMQLLHILAKPGCKLTIALALFSVLCTIFSDKISEYLGIIKDAVRACWNWLFGKTQPLQSERPSPNAPVEEDSQATFISLLWSVVATMAGYVKKAPANLKDFTCGLFAKSGDLFRTHVFGVKFFKDFLSLLKRMWSWINRQFGYDKPLYTLAADDKFLQEWAIMASIVLAPEHGDEVLTQREWIGKLFEAQIIGRLIKAAAVRTDKHISRDMSTMIKDTQDKLTKKVEELIKRKCYVPIRQEPFICWFVGDPGVGKTHYSQSFMRHLAKDYQLPPDIFSLVAGQSYYDLLTTQKFILLDDLLNWRGTGAEQTFAQYLQMSGSNMLSLPRAVATEKAVLDNFEFLFVTANEMWFSTICGITCPEAYNRRRHITVTMDLKRSFVANYSSHAEALLAYKKMSHQAKQDANAILFEVYEYDDTKSKHRVEDPERLYDLIKSYADNQRRDAELKFANAVREHNDAINQAADSSSSFKEYFDKISAAITCADTVGITEVMKSSGTEVVDLISERLRARYKLYEQPTALDTDLSVVQRNIAVANTGRDVQLNGSPVGAVAQVSSLLSTRTPSPFSCVICIKDPKCSSYDYHNAAALQYHYDRAHSTSLGAGTSASPNMPEYSSIDAATAACMEMANESEAHFEKLRDRFELPTCELYKIPDLPVLAVDQGDVTQRELKEPFTYNNYGCPHRRIAFARCFYIRFKDDVLHSFTDRCKHTPRPNGVFIDPEGYLMEFEPSAHKSYACFDIPCVTKDASLDPHCAWTETIRHTTVTNLRIREDLGTYWSSLVGLLIHKMPSWQDFNQIPDDQLRTIAPPLLVEMVRNVYRDDCKYIVDKRNKTWLQRVLLCIKSGFVAERVIVDGVCHGVYPTQQEMALGVRDGVCIETARQRGILYDDVTYHRNDREVKVTEPSLFCKLLIHIGLVLAGISGLILFIDFILCFLEYWGVFSLWEWNKGDTARSGDVDVCNNCKTPQMSSSGDFKNTKQTKAVVKAVNMLGAPNGFTFETEDPRLNKICSNVFWFVAEREINGIIQRKRARCLGIKGYTGIVLNHYLENFAYLKQKDEGWKFSLIMIRSGTAMPVDFSALEFQFLESGGMTLVTFPVSIGMQFADVTKYIPSEGAANYPAQAALVEVFGNSLQMTNLTTKLTFRKQFVKAPEDSGMEDWVIDQCFEYANCAGNGLCGAFLYMKDFTHPLVGIHTAGIGTKLGFSELLLSQTFEAITKPQVSHFVSPNLKINCDKPMPQGPHVAVGHVDDDMVVHLSHTTSIIPSAAAGLFPTRTEPAPLTKSDPRTPPGYDPFWTAVEKRCDPLKPFPKKLVDLAREDLQNKLIASCKPIRAVVKPLSVSQAIEGLPGVLGMEPIELTTSEGYPWTKMRPKGVKNKKWLFDMAQDTSYPKCIGIHETLRDTLNMKEEMRARGVVPATYFTACLKDARILKEKITVPGKTRLFEMSPVELTIAQRQYFLDFYASYMNSRRDCENTIGINVNSSEWSCLAVDLTSFSSHILGGDYSSYGPRMGLEILHAAWDIIISWTLHYSDADSETRHRLERYMRTMKFECLHSLLIVGGYVMRAVAGMHSGNVATVILNSLCNSLLVRIAYLDIMAKTKNNSLATFNRLVKLFANGDDIIMAVKPEIIEQFNNVSLSEYFGKYGLKYTNSKKDCEVVPYETIFEVSFLKCTFTPHPFREGQWLAPLDKTSVEDCCQWVWKSDKDLWAATIENCDQAVRLAYGHGPAYYNHIRSVISKFLISNGHFISLPTWRQLDDQIWLEGAAIES